MPGYNINLKPAIGRGQDRVRQLIGPSGESRVVAQQQPAVREGIPAQLISLTVYMYKPLHSLKSTDFNTDAQPCRKKENNQDPG